MKNSALFFIAAAWLSGCRDDVTTLHTAPPPVDSTKHITPPLGVMPKDTGGIQTAVPLGKSSSPYGYYIYTPSNYKAGTNFPCLIYLHGSGEIGNSQTDPSQLSRILVNGPPRLITEQRWVPQVPMLVASPQCHDSWWDYQKVRDFIEFIRDHYQVDTVRIYLTGISMGGYGCYDQLQVWGKASHIAAVVIIAGSGNLDAKAVSNAAMVPFWSFHGEADTMVSPDFDKTLHADLHAMNSPNPARLTLYPGVGHDCWTETYDGSGMGTEDPAYDRFDTDVFTWMLAYRLQ